MKAAIKQLRGKLEGRLGGEDRRAGGGRRQAERTPRFGRGLQSLGSRRGFRGAGVAHPEPQRGGRPAAGGARCPPPPWGGAGTLFL